MNSTESEARPSLSRDDRGSIGMMGVLCMGAFACLLFALINLGVSVTEKVELQNASDASVLSGATQVARGLNLIALNNNTQAKLLSLATIWFGLKGAIPIMKGVHVGYQLACKALALIPFVGGALSAGCTIIVNIAKGILAAWEKVVNASSRVFQYPTGWAWKIMKLLERFSGIIAQGTPILAAVEAFRIARANGADFGMMISPSILGGDVDKATDLLLVEFPVRKGTFRDLCNQARGLTKETRESLLMSLLWDIGVDPIAGGFGKIFGGTGVAGAILNGIIAARYASQCGGGSPSSEMEIPADLAVCRQSGGTATWDYKVAYLERRPGEPLDPSPDPLLEEAEAITQTEQTKDCSWGGEGTKISYDPEQYQKVTKVYPDGPGPFTDADVIGQRITQWTFIKAVKMEKLDGGDFDQGDKKLPKPYMLGKDGDEKPSETQTRLNYFGFAYRKKEGMAVASNVLKDMVWKDFRLSYAAARVYNATSFDSFSQDWQVKLVPADLETFSKSSGSVSGLKGVPSSLVEKTSWMNRLGDHVPITH